jgi:RNA polymerase-interacting CarD/CdnL/TRCF family regulator
VFQVGDTVVKSTIGICKISGIRRLEIEQREEDYYVIQAGEASVLVPRKLADSGAIRTPLREEEVENIFQKLEEPYKPASEEQDPESDERYKFKVAEVKQRVQQRNPAELVEILRLLYNKQNDLFLDKKQEECLRTAMSMLVEELAYVLKTTKGRVKNRIQKSLATGRKEGRRLQSAEED